MSSSNWNFVHAWYSIDGGNIVISTLRGFYSFFNLCRYEAVHWALSYHVNHHSSDKWHHWITPNPLFDFHSSVSTLCACRLWTIFGESSGVVFVKESPVVNVVVVVVDVDVNFPRSVKHSVATIFFPFQLHQSVSSFNNPHFSSKKCWSNSSWAIFTSTLNFSLYSLPYLFLLQLFSLLLS